MERLVVYLITVFGLRLVGFLFIIESPIQLIIFEWFSVLVYFIVVVQMVTIVHFRVTHSRIIDRVAFG
ncbi:MAG: hypothetical protein JW384_00729 [Nitrosomonadaceae bacterium]|nr:hypothetical protein [Nitrosomonadaceae bacterium]